MFLLQVILIILFRLAIPRDLVMALLLLPSPAVRTAIPLLLVFPSLILLPNFPLLAVLGHGHRRAVPYLGPLLLFGFVPTARDILALIATAEHLVLILRVVVRVIEPPLSTLPGELPAIRSSLGLHLRPPVLARFGVRLVRRARPNPLHR